MSKRDNIQNRIYHDILVLEFNEQKNTHAQWKCLCMICNKLTYCTASNLKSGNSKNCQSCGQKVTSYKQDCEILEKFDSGIKVILLAKEYKISRKVIDKIFIENKRK